MFYRVHKHALWKELLGKVAHYFNYSSGINIFLYHIQISVYSDLALRSIKKFNFSRAYILSKSNLVK
jgi:hypothetical protein